MRPIYNIPVAVVTTLGDLYYVVITSVITHHLLCVFGLKVFIAITAAQNTTTTTTTTTTTATTVVVVVVVAAVAVLLLLVVVVVFCFRCCIVSVQAILLYKITKKLLSLHGTRKLITANLM